MIPVLKKHQKKIAHPKKHQKMIPVLKKHQKMIARPKKTPKNCSPSCPARKTPLETHFLINTIFNLLAIYTMSKVLHSKV